MWIPKDKELFRSSHTTLVTYKVGQGTRDRSSKEIGKGGNLKEAYTEP